MNAARTRDAGQRYSTIAIVLHWTIAVCVMVLLAEGLWMTDAIHAPATKNFAFRVYQWHKSLGLVVLLLMVLRLAWRLGHRPPPLPASMSRPERAGAHLAHATFYALLFAIPLAGWAMVSASPFGLPTLVFGLFEWPHIPQLAALADKKPAEAIFKFAHKVMAWSLLALLTLHIAAALKHRFFDRDGVLARMWPQLTRKTNG